MQNNLIVRMSNGLGNQLFMYASAYGIAKKLGRKLLIDNESAFESRKNINNYDLDMFNITSNIAPDSLKFKGFKGYLLRKIYKRIDNYKKFKSFFIEKKDKKKISTFSEDYLKVNFSKNIFLEGHFESEKYFKSSNSDITRELTFSRDIINIKNKYLEQLKNTNSICICIRQGRFNEELSERYIPSKINKSWKFTLEQIKYTLKAIKIIKSYLENPKFFLWSNDFTNLKDFFSGVEVTLIDNPRNEKNLLDLYLMTYAKHYIVVPTSYNWWGAKLSKNNNKIVLRPSKNNFSDFFLHNNDFWPDDWKIIN